MGSVPEERAAYPEFLMLLRSKGVRLWTREGQLCVHAPKGVLTHDELERIRAAKQTIIHLLDAERRDEEERHGSGLYPVSYSQLARWRSYRDGARRPMRQIAIAIRWRACLDADALRESACKIVNRHDALRTSIVVRGDRPLQRLHCDRTCDFRVFDLRGIPTVAREQELVALIESAVVEPLDIALDPLFAVRLILANDNEHVIVVAMEHMISDMTSLSIVEEELFTAYGQLLESHEITLPPVVAQFPAYSTSLRKGEGKWRQLHMAYWNEHLAGCGRVRFPRDTSMDPADRTEGWAVHSFRLKNDLKRELQERCRQNGLTLPLGVLAAYGAVVLRWCSADDIVIQYQTDGRAEPSVETAVGFFASVLYLRVTLRPDCTFTALMSSIMEEYCQACEHADFSLISSLQPPPEYTKSTSFNWVPLTRRWNEEDVGRGRSRVQLSRIPLAHHAYKYLHVDQEPGILLYDSGSEIVGSLHYPTREFSSARMTLFARNFERFLFAMSRDSRTRIDDVSLVQ